MTRTEIYLAVRGDSNSSGVTKQAAADKELSQLLSCLGGRGMSWDCGLRYMFSVTPALQPGSMCILHDKEDLSRLEMVQRLAKDGCRLLQNHGKSQEKTSEVRHTRASLRCFH